VQPPIVPTQVSDDVRRRKDTVEYADPKLRHEQAAGELGGPGTPSQGQHQSRAVDEEGVIEGWVNESSAQHGRCGSRQDQSRPSS
jgi:hypothetical protein